MANNIPEDFKYKLHTPNAIRQSRFFLNFATILLFFVLAIVFIFGQTHYAKPVYGQSMCPTLNSEWDLVDHKNNYDIVIVDQYATPKRGDIIIFDATKVLSDEKLLIKRVLAVAGDKLSIYYNNATMECEVRVNDKLLQEQYIETKNWKFKADEFNNRKTTQSWLANRDPATAVTVLDDEYGSIIIPDKHIFALGDNRNNSSDCAMFGPVKVANCLGVVDYVAKYNSLFNKILRDIFGIKISYTE